MKKRTALTAVALSAAVTFNAIPAVAADSETNNQSAASSAGSSSAQADNAGENDKPESEDNGLSSKIFNDDKETGRLGMDKNGASSKKAPEGPFAEGSSGLNRLYAYVESDEWQFITAIVSAVAGLITVITQIAALYAKAVPGGDQKIADMINKLLP